MSTGDESWIQQGADALLQTPDFKGRPVLALAASRLLWNLWWRPGDYDHIDRSRGDVR